MMTNDMSEEMGMTGDPRRCPSHPQVQTSSADGMFDAPCGVCEAEMDAHECAAMQPEPVENVVPAAITLLDALKSVSEHCDHARDRDDVGFSGLDASFANRMAALDAVSPKQEVYVAKFVRKYRRQVVENYETRGMQITQGLKGKAKVAAVDAFLGTLVWTHDWSSPAVAAATESKFTVKAASGATTGDLKHFIVRFPFSYAMVATFKDAIDWRDREFDKKDAKDPKWIVKTQPGTVRALREFAAKHNFTVSEGALAAMEKVAPSQAVAA